MMNNDSLTAAINNDEPSSSSSSLGLSFPVSTKLAPPTHEEQQEEEIKRLPREEEIANSPHLPLPLISIELKKLIGYTPSSQDVVDSIQSQLVEAMWSRYRQENGEGEIDGVEENEEKESSSSSFPQTVVPPPDFDSQIQELLEAKIARFCGERQGTASKKEENPAAQTDADDAVDHQETATPDGSTAKQQQHHFEHLILSYPPKIRNPLAIMGSENSLLDAAKAWNEIHQLAKVLPLSPLPQMQEEKEQDDEPYPLESSLDTVFLQKLSTHLVNTSRTLTWKYAMANELKQIVKNELLWKEHDEWCNVQRQAKLDNLYQVRETLVHQTELAKYDLEHLANKRNQKVAQELVVEYQRLQHEERQRQESEGNGVFDSADDLDLAQELRLMGIMPQSRKNESDVENEQEAVEQWDEESLGAGSYSSYGSSSSSSSSGSDDDDDEDDSIENDHVGGKISTRKGGIPTEIKIGEDVVNAVGDNKNEEENKQSSTEEEGVYQMEEERPSLTLPFQRRKERRKRAKEQKQKEQLEAQREAKREKLRAIKEKLEQQHTSRELILAQTMLNSLEKKVENVDELLESLQDEVWAAEEEEEETIEKGLGINDRTDKPSLSLLDQILAMILGALPPADPNTTSKEQYAFVKSEHNVIVNGWESYFGRLPPAVNAGGSGKDESPEATATEAVTKASQALKPTPQEQREALGIVDNDDADWDADD